MSTLTKHFASLVSDTLPSGDRLDQATTWPDKVREHLRQHDFETVSPQSHLAGSYARRTAVDDIKDVDILVFIPAGREDESPKTVLRELERALKELPDASVDTTVQRRSVRVSIDDFDIDVVPAIIADDDHHDMLLVPDRTQEKWINSKPVAYADALAVLNGLHSQKVKPQIRLIKLWRNLRMTYMQPKSYWLECLVYHGFNNGHLDGSGTSAGPIFADLLEHLVERLGPTVDNGGTPHIADPMLGNNVASGWEYTHAKSLVARLREDAALARRAVNAADDEEAVELWSRVFPGRFPEDVEEAKSAMSDLLLGSKASVSSAGIILPSRRAGAIDLPPVRAYGDDSA